MPRAEGRSYETEYYVPRAAHVKLEIMDDLSGKVALVTGASRGIGRAIAVSLAKAGCKVAINFKSYAEGANEAQREICAAGGAAVSLQADVSRGAEVKRLVAETESALGPVAILVNNAGIARPRRIEDITEDDWTEHVAVNLTSCFLMCQAVLPGMRARRWGRVINMSSIAAQAGGAVGPHYGATKAGMIGLTHGYAKFLVKEGITVNAIAPALIETEMVTNNPNASPDLIPMGRYGTAQEVADVVVMLAGNAYITGQTISVNGGWYLT